MEPTARRADAARTESRRGAEIVPCYVVMLPNGIRALVRMARPRRGRCAACGRRGTAERACDWKVTKDRTCDRALCLQCTSSPAAGNDLCPEHARAWDRWKRAQAARERGGKA